VVTTAADTFFTVWDPLTETTLNPLGALAVGSLVVAL
jgi:hypothetical protein